MDPTGWILMASVVSILFATAFFVVSAFARIEWRSRIGSRIAGTVLALGVLGYAVAGGISLVALIAKRL